MENLTLNLISEKEIQNLNEIIRLLGTDSIFLTGIESSDPFVGGKRRNQLKEAFDFYVNYKSRLANIKSIGIEWLRFGVPYSEAHVRKNEYDFSFMDKVVEECKSLEITLIADLLHFGLPEWLHENNIDYPFFQNIGFAEEFAGYVKEFVKRYPSIKYFTIINEPFITANFSAGIGIWNENRNDEKFFVRAGANIAKAAILAKKEIEKIWREENREGSPVYIQNESFEVAIADPDLKSREKVDKFNIKRFVVLDLILGLEDEHSKRYLIENGLAKEEYYWFMANGNSQRTVLGIDHYPTCVHIYTNNKVIDCDPKMPYRLYEIIKEYWERYRLPMLHTETNGWPEHAETICENTFKIVSQLRGEGYPILGMGWYGDEYQVGWHHALVGPRSHIEESIVGIFYKGRIQKVGILFEQLIKKGFPPISTNIDLGKKN